MKKLFTLLGIITVMAVSGCGTTPSSGPTRAKTDYSVQVSQAMAAEFKKADGLYRRKAYDKALPLLEQYVQAYAYNTLTDRARLRIGQIQLHRGQPKEAAATLEKASKGVYDPETTPTVLYSLMLAYQRMGDPKKAWNVLRRVKWTATRAKGRLLLASFGIKVGKESGKTSDQLVSLYLEVIDAYVILTRPPRPSPEWMIGKSDAVSWVRRWVEGSEMSLSSLRKLAKQYNGKTSGGYVTYKLAQEAYDDGNMDLARDSYESYVRGYPKHEYIAQARTRLAELGRKVDGDYIAVGVVLPFSGRYGRYGKAVLRGIECSAGIMRPCDSNMPIRLIIRDTGSSPEKAAEAFESAISADYVKAVIGPLAHVEVDAVARQAEINEVPIIALSQKKDISESGRYVFRNFLTIEDQVQTLLQQVCSSEDRKAAVLYPNSRVGRAHKELFEKGLQECGGEITAAKSYSPKTGNFSDAIRQLKFSISKHGLDGGIGFDALFIPDSYRNLSRIFPLLSFLNVNEVQLYGTAGWNNQKLVKEFPEIMNGSIFVGGFFADSSVGPTRRFSKTYAQAYGRDPSFLEAYGYDSLQMVKKAVKNKKSAKRNEVRDSLSKISGMPGSTGAISIDRFGEAKRRLFLLTVQNGKIEEL